MTSLWLGVDAGGSKTHALALDDALEVIGDGTSGPGNPLAVGDRAAFIALSDAIERALAGEHASGVHFGVAGFGRPRDDDRIRALVARLPLTCPVTISDDARVAFAAAADPPGTVLVAGTGSIAVAYDARGGEHRSGGHGYLLGDEGSAYWIGSEAVRASLRAADGRGPATRLEKVVMEGLGVNSLDYVVSGTYAEEFDRTTLATLAPAVVSIDDPVATAIADRAAQELALAASTVVRAGGLEPDTIVVGAGGLLVGCAPFRKLVETHLADRLPKATFTVRPSPPAFGAARLARSAGDPSGLPAAQ